MKHFMNTTSIIAVAAVAGFVGFASSGANAASTTGTANATLVTALSVTSGGTPLEFGTIGNAANTVTVDVAGARTATDPSQLAGGAPTAADFNVVGNGTAAFTVTLPASVLIANGPANLTVNNFTHNAPAALTAGAAAFDVGADLVIAGGEAAGLYTGSFTVIVNY